ncbi:hypothetical protein M422DRAFT_274645 [Sphaerobolus stellatus SS14]|uniref:Uncharacterized protein n=1 Tax=Sphaerobolus stellatus (strain SS14) TaxID=990650 RepID=A0A0C9TRN6_SPHS4|nr:hypothetical protein M422DRAFT_274645 [Sphaerobolus stellatus SS14]
MVPRPPSRGGATAHEMPRPPSRGGVAALMVPRPPSRGGVATPMVPRPLSLGGVAVPRPPSRGAVAPTRVLRAVGVARPSSRPMISHLLPGPSSRVGGGTPAGRYYTTNGGAGPHAHMARPPSVGGEQPWQPIDDPYAMGRHTGYSTQTQQRPAMRAPMPMQNVYYQQYQDQYGNGYGNQSATEASYVDNSGTEVYDSGMAYGQGEWDGSLAEVEEEPAYGNGY